MGTGDRPIFPLPNQRLDKKDLNLVSTYIQETINRSLGSIFSGNGGLLSKLEYSLAYNSPTEVAVSFLAFRAAWSAPLDGDPSVYDGGVMTYDPTRPAQVTSSWPIEAFAGQATTFWAKRYASSNAVVDNRAYWQGGTKYAATQTVESEYVEVVPKLSSAGPPDAEFRWVQIAYIEVSGWSGFTPTIKGIYFPDSKFFLNGAAPGSDNWWSMYNPGAGDPGYALGDQLRWIFNVLSRFNDSDWAFHEDGRVDEDNSNGSVSWQDPPSRGFLQIDQVITSVVNELGALDARLDAVELVAGAPKAGGVIEWDGAAYVLQSSFAVAGLVLGVSQGMVNGNANLSWSGTIAVRSYNVTLSSQAPFSSGNNQPPILHVVHGATLPNTTGSIGLYASKKTNEADEASFAHTPVTTDRFIFTLF